MPEVQPRVQHLLAGVAGLSISPKHTVAIFFDSKHRCGRLICQWLIIAVWQKNSSVYYWWYYLIATVKHQDVVTAAVTCLAALNKVFYVGVSAVAAVILQW